MTNTVTEPPQPRERAVRTCSVPNCQKPTKRRDSRCSMHVARLSRTGRLDHPNDLPFVDRIWLWVDKRPDGGCWIWTRHISTTGYGVVTLPNGKHAYAHRFIYETLVGPIPEGFQVDHLCRVTACCNPDHLEAVTPWLNTMRSSSVSAINAVKTHCAQGHLYNAENTRIKLDGARECRTCKLAWGARHRAKMRLARAA